MASVIAGLNNSAVQQLKQDWEKLSENSTQIFEQIERMMNPRNNFSNYRMSLSTAQLNKTPCIPYLAVHLKDIACSSEALSLIEQEKVDIRGEIMDNGKKIHCILKFQKLHYEISIEKDIYFHISNYKHMNAQELLLWKPNKLFSSISMNGTVNEKVLIHFKKTKSEIFDEKTNKFLHIPSKMIRAQTPWYVPPTIKLTEEEENSSMTNIKKSFLFKLRESNSKYKELSSFSDKILLRILRACEYNIVNSVKSLNNYYVKKYFYFLFILFINFI